MSLQLEERREMEIENEENESGEMEKASQNPFVLPQASQLETFTINKEHMPPSVFDPIMASETNCEPNVEPYCKNYLDEDEDNLIFVYGNVPNFNAFGHPKSQLQSTLNESEFFYSCQNEKERVQLKDINIEKPFILIRSAIMALVPVSEVLTLLQSNIRIFYLQMQSDRLSYTTSSKSIHVGQGKNFQGQLIMEAIVSADHCQAGSDKPTYTIKEIEIAVKRIKTKEKEDVIEVYSQSPQDPKKTKQRRRYEPSRTYGLRSRRRP